MNVVFWSFLPGVSRVSSSMLVTSILTATAFRTKCSILQLHHKNNLLTRPVLFADLNESTFGDNGIDALIRSVGSGKAEIADVEDASFSFIEQRFNVFIPTKVRDEKIYQENLLKSFDKILKALDSAFKINFIDVPAGDNPYSRKALAYADYIVVCLPQSDYHIDRILKSVKLPKDKTFYLISDFDGGQYLSKRNIMWKYRENLNNNNCAVIPHCSGLADSLNTNKVIAFIAENINSKKTDKNFEFINNTKKSVEKMLKFMKWKER